MDLVDTLIRSLSASSRNAREAAVAQLVQIGTEAVSALLHVAENGDLVPRMHALIALAKIGAPSAIPLIHHALLGPRDIEAENAAWAAAEMRDETAVPLLQQLITRGNPPLPTTAAIAIGGIGAPGAFEYLCHLPPNDDPGAQDGAIIALGALGDPRAVPVLLSVPSYRA